MMMKDKCCFWNRISFFLTMQFHTAVTLRIMTNSLNAVDYLNALSS